jgi:hypothetical protein
MIAFEPFSSHKGRQRSGGGILSRPSAAFHYFGFVLKVWRWKDRLED